MPVENIPLPSAPAVLDERKTKALEDQARALESGITKIAIALGGISDIGGPKSERFERVLCACIAGRVATDVEGFLTFARELCDGIDREFPDATPSPDAP